MTTGFNIVIGGRAFNPDDALSGTSLVPANTCKKGDATYSDRDGRGSFIEFADFHDGPYPLCMLTEAMDFIRSHVNELTDICHRPDVEYRCLNLLDVPEAGGSFTFETEAIALLSKLQFSVDIQIIKIEQSGPENPVPSGTSDADASGVPDSRGL